MYLPSEEDVEPLVHVRLVAGDQLTQRLQEQGKNLDKNEFFSYRYMVKLQKK
jgi:hypothetical protein